MSNQKPVRLPLDDGYADLLAQLKNRIREAQAGAARAVTHELIVLYWSIGKEILLRQKQQGWGAKVLDRLSQDLRREFPGAKGYSVSNLKFMRSFAEAWPEITIRQQLLTNLAWGHNTLLVTKLKDPEVRLWYAQKAVEHGWSRSNLLRFIEDDLYGSSQGGDNNFALTLPPPQSDLVRQMIKDPYHLDFLVLGENVQNHDLKLLLVTHMREFLLTLGVGFSFVGHDYPIHVDGQEFYIDMLFYHLHLRCFVAIKLEMGAFEPEQSGLMNFYLSAIDDQERREGDQPTIGIILCSRKSSIVAEYALRNLSNPIAVAEHRIPTSALPSKERLKSELEAALRRFERLKDEPL